MSTQMVETPSMSTMQEILRKIRDDAETIAAVEECRRCEDIPVTLGEEEYVQRSKTKRQ